MPRLTMPLDHRGQAVVHAVVSAGGLNAARLRRAGAPVPLVRPVPALIDSGAARSVVDPAVRDALGLNPFRVRFVLVPGSTAPLVTRYYRVHLTVPHPAGSGDLVVPRLTVAVVDIAHTGTDVLVGCDVLALCNSFTHEGKARRFTLDY
jgi:hypothetical protein